jgi:DNA-binding MarR family transcriptional regulator
MTIEEVLVLSYLGQEFPVSDAEQLADLTGLSKRSVSGAVQKLEKRGMIKRESIKAPKPAKKEKLTKDKESKNSTPRVRKRFRLLQEASPVMYDLAQAEKDFTSVRFENFSGEERKRYERSAKKMRENVKNVLRT